MVYCRYDNGSVKTLNFINENFIEYLKRLAKNQNLTTFRKENLQKQLNLRDNTSNQENELIQFLNEYNLN